MGLGHSLDKAINELREKNFKSDKIYFFSGGSGYPDEACVEYFNGTGITVITRDGKKWLNGKPLEE